MTKFQDNCITQVKAFFSSVPGIPKIDFEEKHIQANNVMGDGFNRLRRFFGFIEIPYKIKELPETSFHTKFKFRDHDFEIYIYEDSSEMHRDDAGFICEQVDYDSEAEMIQDFVAHLSEAISNEHFEGNCRTTPREWVVTLAIFALILTALISGGIWLSHFLSK